MGGRPMKVTGYGGSHFTDDIIKCFPFNQMRKTHTYCPCLMVTGFIYSFQTQMTSWFNLIAANRIIHRNKLPKWFYRATKIFNNNGNHGHDVWLYYFITALAFASVGRLQTGHDVFPSKLNMQLLVHSWPTGTNGSSQKQTDSLSSPFTLSILN